MQAARAPEPQGGDSKLSRADCLQLAAAVIASEGLPASLKIVTLDERLAGGRTT
jgi:hypothetical protein